MTQLPPDIHARLLDFACGVSASSDFETWLYGSGDLESVLPPDEYLDLLSADYKRPAGALAAQELVEALLDTRRPNVVAKYRIELLCEAMLTGRVDLLFGLREIVQFYYQGYTFIPDVFIGLESETDTVPDSHHYHQWEHAALALQLERLEWYRPQLLLELQNLVASLQGQRRAA